jgi:hypothetical protein
MNPKTVLALTLASAFVVANSAAYAEDEKKPETQLILADGDEKKPETQLILAEDEKKPETQLILAEDEKKPEQPQLG